MTRSVAITLIVVVFSRMAAADDSAAVVLREQLAKSHWQLAEAARDSENDQLKAAHHFLAAARLHRQLDDPQSVIDAMRAARGVASAAQRTFVHEHPVRDVTVTPDLSKLITCAGQAAFVWSRTSGELLARWQHTGLVTSVIVHSQEPIAAVNSYDGVTVWDLRTNKQLAQFNANPKSIRGPMWEIRFLSVSRQVLVRHREHVHCWDVDRDRRVYSLDHWTSGMALSAEENELLTYGRDGYARIWDVESGKELESYPHPGSVGQGRFLNDGRILTFALDEPQAQHDRPGRIWLRRSQEPQRLLADGHGTNALTLDPRGEMALSAGTSNLLTYDSFSWSIADGTKIATLSHEEMAQGGGTFATTQPTRPRQQKHALVFTHTKETLKVWDVESLRLRHVVKPRGGVKSVQVSPDGRWLGVLSLTNTAHIYAIPDSLVRRPLLQLRQTLTHGDLIRGFTFLGRHPQAITWGEDGLARIWNLESRQPTKLVADMTPNSVGRPPYVRWAGENHVWAERDGKCQLWDIRAGKQVMSWVPEARVRRVLHVSDDTFAVWGGTTVRVRKLQAADPTATWQHDGEIKGAFYSQANKSVVSWSADQIQCRQINAKDDDEEPAVKTIPLRAIFDLLQVGAKRVIAVDRMGGVHQIDVGEGKATLIHRTMIQAQHAQVSHDQQRIATWSAKGRFAVISLREPVESKVFRFPATSNVEVSADCRHVLMSETSRRQGWLYSLEDGNLLKQFHRDGQIDRELFRFQFLQPGKMLSWGSVGFSNRVRLRIWEIADLSQPAIEYFVPGLPRTIVSQPDGVLIAHVGQGALTLSTHRERVLRNLHQYRFGLNQMLFSNHDAQLYTTNPRGQMWRWDLHAEDASALDRFQQELDVASGMTIMPNGDYRVRAAGD